MELFLYAMIFIMGTVFGSFFTLAVYRLPIGEDITHKHSFCPNCEHKLGLFDLIPIWSYLFLGGKCKYCKKPISIRYFILEVLSGIVFVVFAYSLRINLYQIEIAKWIYLGFGILYFSGLFLIAGIDKEKVTIQRSVLLYGILVTFAYVVYLASTGVAQISYYLPYLLIIGILAGIDTYLLRKKIKDSYPIEILLLCFIMILFTGELVFILTVIFTLLCIATHMILHSIQSKIEKQKGKGKKKEENTVKQQKQEGQTILAIQRLPIGFYLCITNIALLIFVNLLANYLP